MNSAHASSVVVVQPWQLALACGFIIGAAVLITVLKLDVTKKFLFSALRAFIQVLLLGYLLSWLFGLDNVALTISIIAIMSGVAALTASRRNSNVPGMLAPVAFTVLFAVGLTITFIVTAGIIQVEPWYAPRYAVPLAGMVLGNSMGALAIALERVFSDLDARTDEIRGLIALGATPWEVALPSMRAALRAGIIPSMNTLATAGIVFIPGMMSGQVLAGVNPMTAAPYQIIVSFMITAGDISAATAGVMWVYRRRFTDAGVYLEKAFSHHRS